MAVVPLFSDPEKPAPRAATTARPSPRSGGVALVSAGRRGEYGIADVARSLGLLHFSVRTIIDKLRALARHDGMPLPRTPRIVKGRPSTGAQIIYAHSRWDAGEIDAWLDRRSTPTGGAALPVPAPVRTAMAQRALALVASR